MPKLFIFLFLLFFLYPVPVFSTELRNNEIFINDLIVEGFELSPPFDRFQNLYTIISDEYVFALNITIPEVAGQVVSIYGHEDLIYGENIITIFVTDYEGTKANEYTIIFTIRETITPVFAEYQPLPDEIPVIGQTEIAIIILTCTFLLLISGRFIFKKR